MSTELECYFGLCVKPEDRQPGIHWAFVCLQPNVLISWILRELHPLYSRCWLLSEDDDELFPAVASFFHNEPWFHVYQSWNRCVEDLSRCSTAEFHSTVLLLGNRFTNVKYLKQLPVNLARVHCYSDAHLPFTVDEWNSITNWFVSNDIASHFTLGRWIHTWMQVQAGYINWMRPFNVTHDTSEIWINEFLAGHTDPIGSIRCRPPPPLPSPPAVHHSHWMDRMVLLWLLIMVHWTWIVPCLRWLLSVESEELDSRILIA